MLPVELCLGQKLKTCFEFFLTRINVHPLLLPLEYDRAGNERVQLETPASSGLKKRCSRGSQ